MSTYDVNRVTITPEIVQTTARDVREAVDRYLSVDNHWVTSAALEQACSSLSTGDVLSSLTGRMERINQTAGVRAVVERADPAEFRRARELHAQSSEALRAGRPADAVRLAAMSETALSVAAGAAVDAVRHGERLYVDHAVASGLTRLGYKVRRVEGRSCVGVYAERDHHVIAVRVNDAGSMELDVAGLGGGECERPVAQLREELGRWGLTCEIVHQHRHGDDRGGTLIRRAAGLDPKNVAAGIVLDAEGKSTEGKKNQPASAVVVAPRQGVRR